MAMKISYPKGFVEERSWILETLFTDFLGIEIEIGEDEESSVYRVLLANGKSIEIDDAFFAGFEDSTSYIKEENIPDEIKWAYHDFFPEGNLPVLYGKPQIIVSSDERCVRCGIDLFAAAFFMLSRWEEAANKNRDAHDRFPANKSLALKGNFIDRPIVNEIAETLWSMLCFLEFEGERKKRKFELIPTHDVDEIMKRTSLKKRLYKAIYSRVNPFVREYIYDTFDWLMDCSEAGGWKSRFYFMGAGKQKVKYDGRYAANDSFIVKTMKKIEQRGHECGFHPGYYTYLDYTRWMREKKRLQRRGRGVLKSGRQHYLRFSVPETWRIWERGGMEEDMSMGYADHEGFCCGTGDAFRVFDCLERRVLDLWERPLIIMDGTLTGKNYRNLDIEASKKVIGYYVEKAKKYRMSLVILFHTNFFHNKPEWVEYYPQLLKESRG